MTAPVFLGLPTAPAGVGALRGDQPFPDAARTALADTQLRRNLGRATRTIRDKRERAIAELPDWPQLRAAAAAVKDETLAHLDTYLLQLEEQVVARGGFVHWARDAVEANRIVTTSCAAPGPPRWSRSSRWPPRRSASTTRWRPRASRPGRPTWPSSSSSWRTTGRSHILVPAIHRDRGEIREIFLREMSGGRPAPAGLTDDPAALAEAARLHLREKFFRARVAVCGANFAVAETGTVGGGGVRGQRPDVPDAAADPGHRHGHREGGARVAGPRGVPAAAAALEHRRADEPVHLDVGRSDPRRRPAGVPSRPARQRPHRHARRPGREQRRCGASGARRA